MPFLDDAQLRQSIRQQILYPVYLLYGKERYLTERALTTLIRQIVPAAAQNWALQKFDGTSLDTTALKVSCDELPMLAERKCVVLQNPNLEKMAKADFETIREIVDTPNPTTIFLLVFTNPDFNPKAARAKSLIAQMAKIGAVVEFAAKTQTELSRLLRQRAEKASVTLSAQNAQLLITRCGDHLETLLTELDKLLAYRTEGEITRQDIERLTIRSLDSSAFDLSRAMLRNDFNRAFSLLEELFAMRIEPLAILGALNATFIDLYRAKAALLAEKKERDLTALFSYRGREFRIRNAMRDVPRYSMKVLRGCLSALADADEQLKSTRAEGRMVLEQTLARILWLVNGGTVSPSR